jgi:hypothetical protein
MYSTGYYRPSLVKLEFSKQRFLKINIFMKIQPMGAESIHVDRRTDMTKLKVAFWNFANAPENVHTSYVTH